MPIYSEDTDTPEPKRANIFQVVLITIAFIVVVGLVCLGLIRIYAW